MAYRSRTPTRILVELQTSSSTLNKADDQPFTITLKAKVDHDHPVTIDAFLTLLWPQANALDFQGFTFKDIATGALAERAQLNIFYAPPDRLAANSECAVQLPPHNAAETYTVSHSFRMRAWATEFAAKMDDLDQEWLIRQNDQTEGLLVGHVYEIGLGTYWNEVDCWWEGNKAEVFLRGSLARSPRDTPLRMELVNDVKILIVDETLPSESA